MRYGKEVIEQVRQSLSGLSDTARARKIAEWSDKLGVCKSTIYRWDTHNNTSPQAQPNRRKISPETYKKMTSLTVRYGWTSREVVDAAEAHGWIDPGQIHHSTYARYLNQDRISRRALTDPGKFKGEARNRMKKLPHRRWEAPHPNALHQVDATELKQYFIPPEDADIGFEEDKGPNREGNSYPRIHLFVLVDDFSRVCYAELFRSKEAEVWVRFLWRAWSSKADSPFRGRPDTLYSDNDGATRARIFKNFMADMDVQFQTHTPGNPAAKGKVESGGIKYLKNAITRQLRFYLDQGHKMTLDEANNLLSRIVAGKNARAHTETNEIPAVRWQGNLLGLVRGMPEDEQVLSMYMYLPAEVLLRNDLTIQIDSVRYQLPRREPFLSHHGTKITVRIDQKKERRTHLIVQIGNEWHTIEAVQALPDEGSTFKTLPKTRGEHLIEQAYEADLSDVDPGRIHTPTDTKHISMPVPVEPFEHTAPPVPVKVLTRLDAKLRLRKLGIAFSVQGIEQMFGDQDTITEEEYEQHAAQIAARVS